MPFSSKSIDTNTILIAERQDHHHFENKRRGLLGREIALEIHLLVRDSDSFSSSSLLIPRFSTWGNDGHSFMISIIQIY